MINYIDWLCMYINQRVYGGGGATIEKSFNTGVGFCIITEVWMTLLRLLPGPENWCVVVVVLALGVGVPREPPTCVSSTSSSEDEPEETPATVRG